MSDKQFEVISHKNNQHHLIINGKHCTIYVDANNVVTGGYFVGSGKRSTQTINPNKHVRIWKIANEYASSL